jgi:hypothetical protein
MHTSTNHSTIESLGSNSAFWNWAASSPAASTRGLSMSNHLHLVVHMSPDASNGWTSEEVAERWVKLYPAHTPELCTQKIAAIVHNTNAVAEYRTRLTNLSWLMKSLSEPIARRANAEDKVTGRLWEGRFKCQALLSEKSILAAMTYVDLNPVRASIAECHQHFALHQYQSSTFGNLEGSKQSE